MKDRTDGFLSDERIRNTEVFDYIQELHGYLWRFVRAVHPGAGGHLDKCVDGALEAARKLEEEKERAQFDALKAQAENAKLQQKVLQYSRERSVANRAELEAKQQVWVLEQEKAHLRRVRDAAILYVSWHMADDKWARRDPFRDLRDALSEKDGER